MARITHIHAGFQYCFPSPLYSPNCTHTSGLLSCTHSSHKRPQHTARIPHTHAGFLYCFRTPLYSPSCTHTCGLLSCTHSTYERSQHTARIAHTHAGFLYCFCTPLYSPRIKHIHVGSYPLPIVPTNAPNIQPELHTFFRASSTLIVFYFFTYFFPLTSPIYIPNSTYTYGFPAMYS